MALTGIIINGHHQAMAPMVIIVGHPLFNTFVSEINQHLHYHYEAHLACSSSLQFVQSLASTTIIIGPSYLPLCLKAIIIYIIIVRLTLSAPALFKSVQSMASTAIIIGRSCMYFPATYALFFLIAFTYCARPAAVIASPCTQIKR